ncbi:MAG: OmpA family protein [Pseudomonadota bacterium]|nr:OmpA family protein [Pseudomonadota bacterium]
MNMKSTMTMGSLLALAACASSPQPNAALETARAAVQSAEADPNVSKYAALDLDTAKKDLEIAETAAMHHRDAEVAQPAYLAAQTARLAQVRASAKADDARVAAGQAERDRIQLQARSREVQNAEAAANAAKAQTAAAQEQSARLQAEIEQLKATPTDRGLVLTLGDVLFDTGKSELNAGATRKLDQLAQFLSEHPDRRVQIDGFTDSTGSDAYNQELSRRRADAVKSALLTRGIGASRIGTQGYGKAYPVANNTDPSGRQLNRRVEVVIGGDNGTPIAPRG